jgi:tetratricopeptide (TPR) repeat protein
MIMRVDRRCGALGLLLVVCLTGCRVSETGKPPSALPAEREARKALTGPQVADVQIAMAQTLEEGGTPKQAAAIYTQALKKDPKRADACLRLAILCDKEGKFEESAHWYDQAASLAPDDPEVYANRGYGLYLQQQWAVAEKNLREAIRLDPDHRRYHNNLGLVLARRGRYQEALGEFSLAGCSEAEARVNLGHALTLEHRWQEATEQYLFALKRDPSCARARQGMDRINLLLARLKAGPQPGRNSNGDAEIVRTAATMPQSSAAAVAQPVPK